MLPRRASFFLARAGGGWCAPAWRCTVASPHLLGRVASPVSMSTLREKARVGPSLPSEGPAPTGAPGMEGAPPPELGLVSQHATPHLMGVVRERSCPLTPGVRLGGKPPGRAPGGACGCSGMSSLVIPPAREVILSITAAPGGEQRAPSHQGDPLYDFR
jgi:hypothetical protein